jgi:hypothetical protein
MGLLTRRLDANWDMSFGNGLHDQARDAEATAQNCQARIQVMRGEWFLNINAGVGYLTTKRGIIEAEMKQTLIDSPGVQKLTQFITSFGSSTRVLSVYAELVNIYGTTATIRSTLP